MKKLETILNKQVANLSVLFTKLHNHHWYVKGPNFFSLHEKFEGLYDEINELYDEFAERLLTIGGNPVSTQKGNLELTSLKEVAGELDAKAMVQMTHDDLLLIVKEMNEGIGLAGELGDEATVDLFVSTVASLEKHAWMFRFYNL